MVVGLGLSQHVHVYVFPSIVLDISILICLLVYFTS